MLLSVPHAGRAYASAILGRSRVPLSMLMRLEDRYADHLPGMLLAQGYPALIAYLPRAVIDLNRSPRDIDPRMIADMPHSHPYIQTVKQRAGLGLFPRSLHRCGGLWRGLMTWEEAGDRIKRGHEAYHSRLAAMLGSVLERNGQAVLMDIHSMPPLPDPSEGRKRPDIVIGDLHGASASARYGEIALAVVRAHGLTAAYNHPYPGSYVLERHGAPMKGRHAIQVEISRDLYLDDELVEIGSGIGGVQSMLADMAEKLMREARAQGSAGGRDESWKQAAE